LGAGQVGRPRKKEWLVRRPAGCYGWSPVVTAAPALRSTADKRPGAKAGCRDSGPALAIHVSAQGVRTCALEAANTDAVDAAADALEAGGQAGRPCLRGARAIKHHGRHAVYV